MEVVIDAAPDVQGPRSVIVINNGQLAIWPQTGHFVCPQSRLDKWKQCEGRRGGVVRIKRNRCSREESPRWEAAAGNMFLIYFFFFVCFVCLFLPSRLQAGERQLSENLGGLLLSWIRVVGFGYKSEILTLKRYLRTSEFYQNRSNAAIS